MIKIKTNIEDSTMQIETTQPHEEFLRQVLFMKDAQKVLAVFPFYHNINDLEYRTVIDHFFDETDAPPKQEFCLIHESEFGWGWIHNSIIPQLNVAVEGEYEDFKKTLVANRVIKPNFVLNEG